MRAATVLVLASVLASGCSRPSPTAPTAPPPTAAPPSPAASYAVTTLAFTSDPEEFVGRGEALTHTLDNSLFSAIVMNDGGYLSIVIRPRNGTTPIWNFRVTSPNGSKILPGTYATTGDVLSNSWSATFFGGGRACARITGRMVVHAFDFTAENQALKHFRASFEQQCDGAPPKLRGEVAVLADPWR